MSSYIQPHMVEGLRQHQLLEYPTGSCPFLRFRYFVLRRPGDGNLALHLIFSPVGIVLGGDLTIGGRHGCIGSPRYDVDWFASPKSEDYLCEKFLRREWQWEKAREVLLEWLRPESGYSVPREHEVAIAEMIRSDPPDVLPPWFGALPAGDRCYWMHDQPTPHELGEMLHALDSSYVDDGVPGMDYPRADAGWLCAVQQRFVALYPQRTIVLGGPQT